MTEPTTSRPRSRRAQRRRTRRSRRSATSGGSTPRPVRSRAAPDATARRAEVRRLRRAGRAAAGEADVRPSRGAGEPAAEAPEREAPPDTTLAAERLARPAAAAGRVRQLQAPGRPRPRGRTATRPSAASSRRCCRCSTTSTWRASTATSRAGRSRPSPTSSRRPSASSGSSASARPARRSTRRVHEALMHVEAELAEGTDGDDRRPGAPAGLPASASGSCAPRASRSPTRRARAVTPVRRHPARAPVRARTTARRRGGTPMASQDWFEKDFYAILGVPRTPTPRRSRRPTASSPASTTPTTTPGTPRPSSGSRRSARPTRSSPTPSSASEYDAVRAMAHGGARFTAGGPAVAARRLRGPLRRPVRRRRRRRAAATSGSPRRRRRRPAQPRGPARRMFGQGGGRSAAARGGLRRLRRAAGPAARRRRHGAATTLGFRDAVEGATVTLQSPTARRDHHARSPPGVKDGQKIRLRGKGRPGDPGAPAGDLILTVHGRASTRCSAATATTSPSTCRSPSPRRRSAPPCRCRRSTATPVKVRVAPGTPSGRVLRVKGRGVAEQGRHTATCWPRSRSSCRSGSPTRRARRVEALRRRRGRGRPARRPVRAGRRGGDAAWRAGRAGFDAARRRHPGLRHLRRGRSWPACTRRPCASTTGSAWSPRRAPAAAAGATPRRDVALLREVQRLSQEEGVSLAGIQRILDLENQVDGAAVPRRASSPTSWSAPAPRSARRARVFAAGRAGDVVAVRAGQRPRAASAGRRPWSSGAPAAEPGVAGIRRARVANASSVVRPNEHEPHQLQPLEVGRGRAPRTPRPAPRPRGSSRRPRR